MTESNEEQTPIVKVTGKNPVISTTNIKGSPITTVMGILISLIGIGIVLVVLVIPNFYDPKSDSVISPIWEVIIGLGMMVGGIVLILAPDKFVGIATKYGERKADEL